MSKVDELRAQLREAEREESKEREARIDAYNALPWEWCVKVNTVKVSGFTVRDFYKSMAADSVVEEAYIQRRKAGYDETKHYDPDHNMWRGMTYFRTPENILTHNSGGYCVLIDPMLCSDEEWASIKCGEIPAKFQR